MLDCRAEEIDAAAMRLMLLRHAKTEKAESGMRDRDRPLNARGRKDAARIGAYMAHHALVPDRVIVSSARRTRETWERLAPGLRARPAGRFTRIVSTRAAPTPSWPSSRPRRSPPPLLPVIGHNPGLHDTRGC